MYFRNNGRRIAWLDKCLKSLVSEHRTNTDMLKGHKVLSYFFITLTQTVLENVSLSYI